MLQRDTPNTLAAAALVTDAYLYTGDDKYKQWVLDYLEAWIDRTKKNGGVTPDNVDHDGVIGGGREGVFWGGQYGWNHYQGYNIMFHGINTAVECALMLTGDYEYLDLLRSQLKVIVDAAKIEDDGQLITPVRYGPEGWILTPPVGRGMNDGIPSRGVMQGPSPMRAQEMMHLYHASMDQQDYEFITSIRDQDVRRDWNEIGDRLGEKNSGETEFSRFQYYDGKNPDWPMKILSAEYNEAITKYEEMMEDDRAAIRHHHHQPDAAASRPHEGPDAGDDGHTAGDLQRRPLAGDRALLRQRSRACRPPARYRRPRRRAPTGRRRHPTREHQPQ